MIYFIDKKILLVDDEEGLLKMLKTILEDEGFHNIVTAGSVQTGLKAAREEKPDLAVLVGGELGEIAESVN